MHFAYYADLFDCFSMSYIAKVRIKPKPDWDKSLEKEYEFQSRQNTQSNIKTVY